MLSEKGVAGSFDGRDVSVYLRDVESMGVRGGRAVHGRGGSAGHGWAAQGLKQRGSYRIDFTAPQRRAAPK